MRLSEETVYDLAEMGDGKASFILRLAKAEKSSVFWYDQEVDIDYGEFYLYPAPEKQKELFDLD